MISLNSLKKFTIINTVLTSLACVKYFFRESFYGSISTELFVNTSLIIFQNVAKPRISNSQPPQPSYKGEFLLYVASASLIKGVTHHMLMNNLHDESWYSPYFILSSFLFEIIFDLSHYTLHRTMHSLPFLYPIHKTHHKFLHPSAITTFYMNPLDLILSYSVPLTISSHLIELSQFDFLLMTVYLTYQEIAGHLGKEMCPTSCFAQCIWLPRMLGIELYTEDHDLHHSQFKYNFGKRFSLWDKLFGTFKSSIDK